MQQITTIPVVINSHSHCYQGNEMPPVAAVV